jgi:hypothetical protein
MIVKTNLRAGQDLSAIDPNQALALGTSLFQTYAGQVDQQALMDLAGQVDQQQLMGLAQSFAANPSAALSMFTP